MGSQLTPEVDGSFVSETFLVKALGSDSALKTECRWRFSPPLLPKNVNGNAYPYYKSIDLILNVTSSEKAETNGHPTKGTDDPADCTETPLGTIINKLLTTKPPYSDGSRPKHVTDALIKVLMVPHDGYLCRRDILQLRMVHSDCIESVIPLQVKNKPYPAVLQTGTDLLSLLRSSPGALICTESIQSADGLRVFNLVDREVNERLSFDWILPDKPPSLTVAVVGGRPLFDSTTEGYGSEGPFDAARALGIAVIVLDRPRHFMEGPKYSHLRDDFIAVDMTSDDGLPQRLTAAVKSRKVDGIITFSDEYVIATAKAAEMLNLETEPVESIITAHYKDATRKVLNTPNMESFRLESATDLDNEDISKTLENLKYPLVIKPCRGGASRGVKKVQNHHKLREAIDQLESDGLTKYGILLETYISGPEIDANIALWDGELMFAEITDDFPCTADASDATIADNFGETVMVSPTLLSQKEQELIKSSLHQTLLKLGFRNGVFHVEARVQNSNMRYQEIDGLVDLADTDSPSPGDPEVYLIEVNARPPGLDCAFSTLHAYGVDLCALQLLQCLRDGDRFKAMCKPFLSETQYWSANCLIPIHRHNILVPEGFCGKVLERMPDVAPLVYRSELFRQPGTLVSPPLGVEFLAYFLVQSGTDRRKVLQTYHRLIQTCRVVLDEV
ncbi:carnosine synthase 1 [Fusarium pseudocircinatum]|uniref:Carnosine synthase 1 n=1 Tax=Fusarium pseudocircinatum TaxID=56676 RepID=A0A8H5P9H7_9HYPO|nr:carnosine synthase 1 [Fusarium pseudocircinatum]